VAEPWKVVFAVEEGNPAVDRPEVAENGGGMVVYVTDGSMRREVTRVAFVREHSKNPDVLYEDQLDAEVRKAQKSVDLLNAQFEQAGVLQ
jgi:hypothetical protein